MGSVVVIVVFKGFYLLLEVLDVNSKSL